MSDPADGPGSSARFRLRQRRAMRLLLYGGLGIVGLSLLGFLVIPLLVVGALDGDAGLGGLLLALAWLVPGLLLPVGVPLLFCAVLVAVIVRHHRRPAVAAGGAPGPSLSPDLRAEVARFETIRQEAARRVRLRLWLLVPLGIGTGILLWSLPETSRGRSTSTLALPLLASVGGLIGWFVAVLSGAGDYAARYKDALMPRLLGRFGAFAYARHAQIDTARLAALGLLPLHARAEGGDEISGRHRGRDVRVNEVALQVATGERTRTIFQGVIVTLAPGSPALAPLLVRDRAGGIDGDRYAQPAGLVAVDTGDPVFDAVYRVFGPGEDTVRTRLTPDIRARLLAMSDGTPFHPPGLLAEEDRLVFSLSAAMGHDLFEPPNLSSHDAAQQLATLEADLVQLFGLIDAMAAMPEVQPAGVT